jgi:hypothetical protein
MKDPVHVAGRTAVLYLSIVSFGTWIMILSYSIAFESDPARVMGLLDARRGLGPFLSPTISHTISCSQTQNVSSTSPACVNNADRAGARRVGGTR